MQDGKTPLHCAASNGQKEVLQLLIERGADIEAKASVSAMIVVIVICHHHAAADDDGCSDSDAVNVLLM